MGDSGAWLGWVQWPAMLVTLLAGWFAASSQQDRREWGFRIYVLSNVLWCLWGWHSHAWALIVLQVGLFLMNLRGVQRNQD